MRIKTFLLMAIIPVIFFWGCNTQHEVKVDPIRTEHVIEVKPMEMTINVNVNVKVDKALNDFFGDLDSAETKSQ